MLSQSLTLPVRSLLVAGAMAAAAFGARPALAQNGFYAAIAYSQSTGKIGFTARQARTEDAARQLAAKHCGEADAKTFIWGPNQWVAIAIVDGRIGTAGFGRGPSADAAQLKALEECKKRARGAACRVALCLHSDGMRPRQLRSIPADPNVPPPPPKSEFVAAIAFSPSTGKIGHTTGKARTAEEAQKLALKDCGAPDAKAFMWGGEWVAIAICDSRRGVAGFAPGATRELAEKQALAQCTKLARGAPCRIALAVHSSHVRPSGDAQPASSSGEVAKPDTRRVVTPAAATGEQPPSAPTTNGGAPR